MQIDAPLRGAGARCGPLGSEHRIKGRGWRREWAEELEAGRGREPSSRNAGRRKEEPWRWDGPEIL